MNTPPIEPYFSYYQGEESNPYDPNKDSSKSRLWNLEYQWILFKDNESYIIGALTLYCESNLEDFCCEDRVPIEFKAYLHRRMITSKHYCFTPQGFQEMYYNAFYFNRINFKYYKRESKNPFPKNDVKNKFWYGEMMFVQNHQQQSFEHWIKEGKKCIDKLEQNCESEKVTLLKKYSMESLGILMYIGTLFDKWTTLDTTDWIFKY